MYKPVPESELQSFKVTLTRESFIIPNDIIPPDIEYPRLGSIQEPSHLPSFIKECSIFILSKFERYTEIPCDLNLP